MAEFTEKYPDVFAGSAYAHDYSTLTVFATDLGSSAVAQLKAAVRGRPSSGQVHIRRVAHSMSDLEVAAAAIDLDAVAGGVSIGPDVTHNAVVLARDAAEGAGPEPGSSLTVGELRRRFAPGPSGVPPKALRRDLDEIAVDVVPSRGRARKAEDRYNDVGPYFTMGAAIFYSGKRCSLGVPLILNGTYMALTAGHCSGPSFTNQSGAPVGTRYTTSYSANANVYGDWQLIRGQHYNLSVWNGGQYGGSTLPMVGADWGTRPIGSQVCTSGSTTGQVCRFVVSSVNQTVTVDGVVTGKQTIMYHDNSLSGARDCAGFGLGDSGGPAYYANGTGGVLANGIVTGLSPLACTYVYTQLAGVRAWNASVAFG